MNTDSLSAPLISQKQFVCVRVHVSTYLPVVILVFPEDSIKYIQKFLYGTGNISVGDARTNIEWLKNNIAKSVGLYQADSSLILLVVFLSTSALTINFFAP